MFQRFKRRTTPDTGRARLAELRKAMAAAEVQAFLIPRADAHQGENVAPRDERLAWLTGFTGSAGVAVAGLADAAIFVDGRYRLQVVQEVDTEAFSPLRLPEDSVSDWLVSKLAAGDTLGFDPMLHTAAEIEQLTESLDAHGIGVRRLRNLVDEVWEGQPPPPAAPVEAYPETLAGRSSAEKIAELAAGLGKRDLDATVFTLPDSIAWLLNIRGGDIARTPVPLAYAILHRDERIDLFDDAGKYAGDVFAHLGPNVAIQPPDAFGPALKALRGRVAIDRSSAPVWVSDQIDAAGGAEIVWARDPAILPKACKTAAELAGARSAHLRDGAAMVTFLVWLEQAAAEGALSEIDVVTRLEEIRRATNVLRDISFETICGAGPNGAIVHYRVSEESNRAIRPGEVLLVDSGGQYLDGTTDITRTVAIGAVRADATAPFTRVLQGLIRMSMLRWPAGLAGRDIDAIARAALWSVGFDYDHGTGHGVGAYLGVHEGPQGLSRRSVEPLLPGMIVSIEPGYYREGAFGIRIENLVAVSEPEIPPGGDRAMHRFETLTRAPIDRRMIDCSLLEPAEIVWLNDYHRLVLEDTAPLVDGAAADWLEQACAPLAQG